MDSDGFIRVTRTHRLCVVGRRRYQPTTDQCLDDRRKSSTTVQSIERIISNASRAVGDYVDLLIAQLNDILGARRVSHIVAYGIGSFSNSKSDGAYQLALLIHIYNQLFSSESRHNPIHIYDPMFSSIECEWLSTNGSFELSTRNDAALHRYDDDSVTLYFMPHCGRPLYNNVLYANWTSSRQLTNTIIIGNSLLSMDIVDELYYIGAAKEFCREFALPPTLIAAYPTTFNNMAVSTFAPVIELNWRSIGDPIIAPKYNLLSTEIML